MKRRFLLLLSLLSLLTACRETQEGETSRLPKQEIKKHEIKRKPIVQHDTACIAAVGDIMLGTSYPDNKTLPPDSAKNSFKNITDEFGDADVKFGNLEGTLLDTGAPAYFKLHQLSKAYMFRMPKYYAGVLKEAGFNVLSLANNHIGDFGEVGRDSTMKVLDSLGIQYGGQVKHPSAVFNINGISYGFCAFAPNSNTLSIFGLKKAREIISNLKQRCDIVIVSFHGGGEGFFFEHVPCMNESFNNEKRGDVEAFAHNAIDAGADLILGNGPHVCRAMELYKSRLIAYSLGNFCTYRCVSVMGICGYAPLLKVYLNRKGEFLNGQIVSNTQTHNDGLVKDVLNRAAIHIRQLTQNDFEASGLNITNSGLIAPVKD